MDTTASPANDDAAEHAAAAGLRHVSDADPGIRRLGTATSFRYVDADGQPMRDAETLERIRALAIPPAYTDVWICPDPRGHLQATGRDARGRKQYRYHPRWRRVRGEGKFARLVTFGAALPKLRRAVRRDLKLRGYPREKVLAIVVAVMAETLLRVGNDEYVRSNRSYGLTTLRNQHVAFLRGGARFRFRGKSGQQTEALLDDERLARLLRRCQQLPGQALFQYVDDEGVVQPVDSGLVNDYLRAAMGAEFTAKDFRTWGATLAAFRTFAETPLPEPWREGEPPSERSLAIVEKRVVEEVAALLGNTPMVCRNSYIDPAVFAGWRDGRLQKAAAGATGGRQWERAALKFLKSARRETRRAD